MGLSTSLCNEMGKPQLSFKRQPKILRLPTSGDGMFQYNR